MGNAGGNISVYITVTNFLDETANFNILCMVVNKDAVTPSHSHPYSWMVDGDMVYPNLSAITANLTWSGSPVQTLNGSIKQTGNLSPGASVNLTWPTIYTTDASGWIVWCAGESYIW